MYARQMPKFRPFGANSTCMPNSSKRRGFFVYSPISSKVCGIDWNSLIDSYLPTKFVSDDPKCSIHGPHDVWILATLRAPRGQDNEATTSFSQISWKGNCSRSLTKMMYFRIDSRTIMRRFAHGVKLICDEYHEEHMYLLITKLRIDRVKSWEKMKISTQKNHEHYQKSFSLAI